jgi:hypothetical protein
MLAVEVVMIAPIVAKEDMPTKKAVLVWEHTLVILKLRTYIGHT